MKLIGRVIIIVLLVLTVLISGFALLCALGIVGEMHISLISEAFYSSLGTRAVVATACVFVILITRSGCVGSTKNEKASVFTGFKRPMTDRLRFRIWQSPS